MTIERKDQRYTVELAAEVHAGRQVLLAATRNLSRGGVCLDVEQPLTEGAAIGVSLFLTTEGIEDPDSEPLNVKAEVVWCSARDDGGHTAGLKFTPLAEEQGAQVDLFLGRLSSPDL